MPKVFPVPIVPPLPLLTSYIGIDSSVASLALAWVALNPNTSTVILGASRPEQLLENLKALQVIPKLTPEVLKKIEAIVANKPEALPTYGRPALDLADDY